MANKEVTWLSGQVGKIIYDDKKGFMIFLLKTGKRSIVVKGEFLQIPKSSDIRILGSYVTDPKYGRQFAAISYQFLVPDNMNLWKKWLGSGVIKGMRGKTAQKIIDHFGKDTMDILNGHPKKLAKVPGIGINRARVICNKFQEHTQNADTLLTLCNYGVPIHMGKKIVKKYGADTISMEAQTLHRLLEYGKKEDGIVGFRKNKNNPLKVNVVIIDESSMIDQALMYALLKALPPKCQLILIGDKNQLPSVGAGRILADIITSGICPVVELKKIYRQSEDSYIAEAAHGILKGKVPYPWGKPHKIKDFYFIPIDTNNKEKAADIIAEYAGKKIPSVTGKEVQVLATTRVRATGCDALNGKIKETVNPADLSKKEYKDFREGDKIIQIKNNYNINRYYPTGELAAGVFNGDTGEIIEIDDENELVTVRMDDESEVSYTYEDMDQVELSYAITIHKSQGSEYPVILIPVFDFIPMLTDRQLIYTAITRAKEMVVLMGDYKKLQMIIRNTRSVRRFTRLEKLLINA